MPKPAQKPLTRLELEIMQAVWKLGPSTVQQVKEALETERAYTTVQTMLNILEGKGQLKRKLRGRSYEYSAAVTEAKASRHALRDLIDRVFSGSADELVMSLLRTKQLDPKRLAELSRKLAREQEEEA